jgi:hypothetical protein
VPLVATPDAVVAHRPAGCGACQAPWGAAAPVVLCARRPGHARPPAGRLLIRAHRALPVRCPAGAQGRGGAFPPRCPVGRRTARACRRARWTWSSSSRVPEGACSHCSPIGGACGSHAGRW